MKPLRVLQISQNYYVRGGSDVMFFKNIELLRAHGHEVIPFAAQDPRNEPTEWAQYFPPAADFENPGLRDILRFIYSAPARRALALLIEEFRPQIAHLHIYYGKITASILPLLKDAGIPIVQTLHEYKLICPVYSLVSNGSICEACEGRHFWLALPKRCNRGSFTRTGLSVVESYVSKMLGSLALVDHFIAVSDFVRSKHIEYGVPGEKISRVYNFVDLGDIVPSSDPGRYLLYFGRLEQTKGIMTLLEASNALKDIPLKIAGDGEARDDVEAYLQEKGLSHVEFLGFQKGKALQNLIRNSIAVIVPSQWYEPFGLTIAESFMYGRPVIGAAIGAIPEIIEDGVDGLLFEPGDVQALRKHMQWMAENPAQALKMGQAGRRKVETVFTAERYYRELMAIYEKVLDASG